jgi:hypothetical protein
MFWPCGTVPYAFTPTGQGTSYVASRLIQPFMDMGLRADTTVLSGLKDVVTTSGGGAQEVGTVIRTTGVSPPGTRKNEGEMDDSVAGGPSFDQIFLKRVARLQRDGVGYANAIGDERVDSYETSSRCLSYGYNRREIAANVPTPTITENEPLLPIGSPNKLYARLFSGFVPGNNPSDVVRALELRRSVLDYASGELRRLEQLAPASEKPKIEMHTEAIRRLEQQLVARGAALDCIPPAEPDPALAASQGSAQNYGNPIAPADESATLARIGKLHLEILRTAFQCDVIRVASFQWTAACDRVAFGGMYPSEPDLSYRHHPVSHRIVRVSESPPVEPGTQADVEQFLINVQAWFNNHTAEFLSSLKNTQDAFGNSLLDHTIVPFVTDIASAAHTRTNLPALIFGGRALGIQGGQYLPQASRPFNDYWLSIAQAYFPDAPDVVAALEGETFLEAKDSYTGPIPGLWQRPS